MVQKKQLVVRLKWNHRNNQWRLNQYKKIENKRYALLKLAMLPGTEGVLNMISNTHYVEEIILQFLSLTVKERIAFISLCSM